jgi:hypothetical protein
VSAVDDVDELIERYDLAPGEFYNANPQPVQRLWSRRDDVTLAPPSALRRTDGRRSPRAWSAAHRSSGIARTSVSRS